MTTRKYLSPASVNSLAALAKESGLPTRRIGRAPSGHPTRHASVFAATRPARNAPALSLSSRSSLGLHDIASGLNGFAAALRLSNPRPRIPLTPPRNTPACLLSDAPPCEIRRDSVLRFFFRPDSPCDLSDRLAITPNNKIYPRSRPVAPPFDFGSRRQSSPRNSPCSCPPPIPMRLTASRPRPGVPSAVQS